MYVMTDAYGSLRFSAIFSASLLLTLVSSLQLLWRQGDWMKTSLWVISRQLIQAMQLTLSDFYEIWHACRTSFPDSKYTNFFKIGQIKPKFW